MEGLGIERNFHCLERHQEEVVAEEEPHGGAESWEEGEEEEGLARPAGPAAVSYPSWVVGTR